MPVNLNNGSEDKTPRGKFKRRAIWSVVLIGVILLAAFEVADYLVPPLVIRELAETTGTQISIESVDLRLNGSVMIKNLQIKPKQQSSHDNTILRAGTVYVRFGIGSLVRLKPKLKKIAVRDFLLDFQQNLDTGQWNIAVLKSVFSGGGSSKLPIIRLKDGKCSYSKVADGRLSIVASTPVDLRIQPVLAQPDSYSFEVITAKNDANQVNSLQGVFGPGMVTLAGVVSSEDLPIFENSVRAKIDRAEYKYDRQKNYQLTAAIDDIAYKQRPLPPGEHAEKPPFLSKLGVFETFENLIEKYKPSGSVGIELQASGNLNKPAGSKIAGVVTCKDVSITYSKFPYSIENLAGSVKFTENEVEIGTLKGRHGDVELAISGKFTDLGPAVRGNVRIVSEKIPLDDDLYNALFPVQKRLWNDFEPAGTVAFKYSLERYADKSTGYAIDVELQDVNSTYRNFPYPLENLTGNLLFDHNSVTVTNLSSQKDSKVITINGKLYDTNTNQPRYDLDIDVENIPLDKTLAAALPERQQNFYNQFEPAGFGSGKIHVYNKADNAKKVDFVAQLDFRDTSLKPKMLSRPITDITASAQFRPDRLVFEEFDGKYGLVPVDMKGTIEPTEKGDNVSYKLTLSGEDADLNEELFELVPDAMRQFLVELQPSGKIDYSALLEKDAVAGKDDYRVELVCKGVSIKPQMFDMPLENIKGGIVVTPGKIVLRDIAGDANEQGGIHLAGQIALETNQGGGSAIESGSIKIKAERFIAAGVTLNQMQADVGYDRPRQMWSGDNFTAELYGGKSTGKFSFGGGQQKKYFELQVGFQNVDLQKFLADRADVNECSNGKCYSSGTMLGSLNVSGSAKDVQSYLGRCRVNISNMQIGKLSPLAKLLTVLKLTQPSDYAFENMSFDGYIKRGRIQFEQFNLFGKTVSFNGTGWMGLEDKNIGLTLAVRGPRLTTVDPKLISSLADALSTGVLQLDISGSIYKPQVKVKPLPVVKGTLELLGTRKENGR